MQKMQKMQEMKLYESVDVTDSLDLHTYFERPEEFTEFYCKVMQEFQDLENKGYKDVCFGVEINRYSEYGEDYTDTRYIFNYVRNLSNEEVQKETEEEERKEEDERIFSDLCGKISTNSIGSIIQNDDLRKLYLEGNIRI